MVDWKTLFVAGKSVYDDPSVTTSDPVDPLAQSMDSIASSNIKRNPHQLLGEADLNEYQVKYSFVLLRNAFAICLHHDTNIYISLSRLQACNKSHTVPSVLNYTVGKG